MPSEILAYDLLDLAQHVAGKSRPLLAHIYADPIGHCLVATDGTALLAIRDAHIFDRPTLIPAPKEAVRFWKAAASKGTPVLVSLTDAQVTFEAGGSRLTVTRPSEDVASGSPYPDWRRSIPAPETLLPGPAVGFDLVKLARFVRSERDRGKEGYARLWHHEAHRAQIVTFQDARRLGVLMPVRTEGWPSLADVVTPILSPDPEDPPENPSEGEPETSPTQEA